MTASTLPPETHVPHGPAEIRAKLLAMAAEDCGVRARLAADGSLFDGYHPEMQRVHERNAALLLAILEKSGWPSVSVVGREAADAAWLVAQHAIGLPAFQRRCLAELEAAARAGAVPDWQPAMLLDRIRILEGKNQIYGTSFDWDAKGEMSPLPIKEAAGVDERRRAVGLPPLAEAVAEKRQQSRSEPRPRDFAARQREMESWARRVGWR